MTTKHVTLSARRRTVHATTRRLARKVRQTSRHGSYDPFGPSLQRKHNTIARIVALIRVLETDLREGSPNPRWAPESPEQIAEDARLDAEVRASILSWGLPVCP